MAFGGGDPTPMSPIQEAIANHRNSVIRDVGPSTNMDSANIARRTLLQQSFGNDFQKQIDASQKQQRTLLNNGVDPEDDDQKKIANNGTGSGAGGQSLGGSL